MKHFGKFTINIRSVTIVAFVALCLSVMLVLVWHSRAQNSSRALFECPKTADGGQYLCWNSAISELLKEDKIVPALVQLDEFSKESPEFITACHSFAHQIGELAYEDFESGKKLTVSPEMQVCDFGFYHGFMTVFLGVSRDFKAVGRFCSSMETDTATKETVSYSRSACFHGIGHGSAISHDPAEWEHPLTVLNGALAVCRSAAQTHEDFLFCVGGIFNGMAYGPYLDHLDKKDPYKICRSVAEEDSPNDCYANLASVVFNLTPDRTIREAIDLASTYTPNIYLLRAIPTFANMASRQEGSEEESISTCLELPSEQRTACLRGYITGLVQRAVPEQKQKGAYALCSGPLIPDQYRADCFTYSFETLGSFWSEKKMTHACDLAEKGMMSVCKESLAKRIIPQ